MRGSLGIHRRETPPCASQGRTGVYDTEIGERNYKYMSKDYYQFNQNITGKGTDEIQAQNMETEKPG
jgi:hypothetical protein